MTAAAEPITQEEVERLEEGFVSFVEVVASGKEFVKESPRAAYLYAELQSRFTSEDFAAFVIASSEATIEAVKAAFANGFERGAIAHSLGEVEVLSEDDILAADEEV